MELNELDGLYREAILDHCRNPRNLGAIDAPEIEAHAVNPFCGDEIFLQIGLDAAGRVERVGLDVRGCSIMQATGSMLSEAIEGKTLDEIEVISAAFHKMMRGDTEAEEAMKQHGDLDALASVRQFPVRIKCALLSWTAIEDGIEEFRKAHPP
ncbi:MAG: SUF system NifU family Fe-S cluster assembly protein [Chloroflexi bacterium]|nr:SUF system NifU family Fe-S cluster assembly protein [Chloroflexota bacterium]